MRPDINYKEKKKKKDCKKHKRIEIKQYISRWWPGYWGNQKGNKKETNDNENMTTKKPMWHIKSSSEGSLKQYNPTWRNKKNIE